MSILNRFLLLYIIIALLSSHIVIVSFINTAFCIVVSVIILVLAISVVGTASDILKKNVTIWLRCSRKNFLKITDYVEADITTRIKREKLA